MIIVDLSRPKGDHIPPKGRRRSPQVPRRVSPLQITSPASIFSESLADLAAASPLAEGEAPPGASFNMLNVLARVANDQPEVYPQPVFTPGSIESEPPFDRDSFLAEFRAEAATLDADPYAGVAILEAGLAELYPLSIESVPTGEVMYERLDYPRLDVGDAYDLVTCGILTLNEIHGLADVYWNRIQPVCRVLDPDIHTVDYLLSQSSLLATVVIATAAQCLPVSELANSIVARLEAHIDFLLTEIDKHGFQSTEICQALTLFCLFMGGHQLQRTWGLTARAIAIAIELHIDVSPPPEWVFVQSTHHSASAVALQRNVERVWMLLVDWDRACAFIRGRRPMICQPAQVDPERLFTWCTLPGAHKADPYTAGFVVLLDIVGRLQFQTARQLMQQGRQFDFGAHSAQVEALLDAWKAKWIALFLEEDRHRSLLDVEGLRLIVLMMPYEYGVRHRWPTSTTGAGRETCLSTAKAIIIQALPILGGTETVVKVSSLYTYR